MGTARVCLCARCRTFFLVCSRCDRGQRYCGAGCSQAARGASLRQAGKRYQEGRRGRLTHAARQRRYRARQEKVTHQGSPPAPSGDLLATDSTLAVKQDFSSRPSAFATWRCHFCGRPCAKHVRLGFLRTRRAPRWHTTEGADGGDFP